MTDGASAIRRSAEELKALAARLETMRGAGSLSASAQALVDDLVARQGATLAGVAGELLDAADELVLRVRLAQEGTGGA